LIKGGRDEGFAAHRRHVMVSRFLARYRLALAAALAVSAIANPHTASRAQAPSFPSGSLTLGAVTADFRPDGTLVVEASIQGTGAMRATAQWKSEADIVELVAWNSKGSSS
jgi:hypothetical protein